MTPTPVNQPAIIVFDADFFKDTINEAMEDLIDKTKDSAKPILTNAAEQAIPVATTYVGNFIKDNVTTKVNATAKPFADAGVDVSTKKSEDGSKQALPQLVDESVETTSEIGKKALKKGVDSSVDSSASLFSRIYTYLTS